MGGDWWARGRRTAATVNEQQMSLANCLINARELNITSQNNGRVKSISVKLTALFAASDAEVQEQEKR